MATTRKKACCEETKEKMRRQLVAAALSKCYFESEREREETVDIYSRSEMSLEDIIMTTAPLREMNSKAAKSRQRIFGSNSKVGIY
jgi:hypothetical protein